MSTRSSVPIVLGAMALVLLATRTSAYNEYGQGCNNCHDFRGGAAPTLHDRHRTAVNDNCRLCHESGGPAAGVSTWRSPGDGSPNSRLSCAGCHGLDYGDIGTDGRPKTTARGLRLHHLNKGVAVCGSCHTDKAPLGENVKPLYYARTDVTIKDPCRAVPPVPTDPASEDLNGNGRGLDNDGDLLYDTLDPDCQLASCTAVAAAQPATSLLCEGDGAPLSDAGSTANCPAGGALVYEWWQGAAGAPGSQLVGNGTSYGVPPGLAPGTYAYDLAVYCSNQTTCRDTLNPLLAIQVFALPGRVYPLHAVKDTLRSDVRFHFTVAGGAGLHRVYSVGQKTQIPPRGDNLAATARCATTDGLTDNCAHVGAIPSPPTLLFYQVVATCNGNPSTEGPN